ncbi:MAG: GAF domain-containing sensor histidine kinase [Solirubrobacteraceae bacterium]
MEISPSIIPPDEDERLAAVRRYQILDTPPDGAFDRVTQLAARLFGVPISIVSIVDEDRIWFKSRHGIDAVQVGRDPGLCASAILQHEPLVIADASVDPYALANPLVAGDLGLRFYAGAPLTTWDGHNLGTLCVIDKEPRLISDEDAATLEDLAAIVVHELELRLATQAIVDREREQRALAAARHGLEAAERERTRWARELHDETLQSLGALHMLLLTGVNDHEKMVVTVNEAAEFVLDETVKLRHLIAELRPAVLDEVGLSAALESLAHRLKIVEGLEVELQFEVPQPDLSLTAEAESVLYRAVQEALTNVAKHSSARHVEVAVRSSEHGIEATVRDDGAGFDVGSPTGGFGLLGLRERALLAGGEVEVRSAPGAGTSVRFVVPCGDTRSSDEGQGSISP